MVLDKDSTLFRWALIFMYRLPVCKSQRRHLGLQEDEGTFGLILTWGEGSV